MFKNKNTILKLFFLALLIFPIGVFANMPQLKNQMYATVLPSIVADLSNQSRLTANLPSLKTNSKLQKAAQLRAQDMADRSYLFMAAKFATNNEFLINGEGISNSGKHESWYWLDQVGYNYSSIGENIAIDLNNSAETEIDWINSSEHQKNILDKKYTETGIGIAKGNYQGRGATFIVQYFGKPAPLRENPLTMARPNN